MRDSRLSDGTVSGRGHDDDVKRKPSRFSSASVVCADCEGATPSSDGHVASELGRTAEEKSASCLMSQS